MSGLKGALSARINDGQTERIITRYCSGLKFTKVADGGHQRLSCKLLLPRNTFRDLGPNDRLYVDDTRTTRTTFDSYLENPTPVHGPDGQSYDISAVGGMALANDETRALAYLDYGVDQFTRGAASADSATLDQGDSAAFPGLQRIRAQFNRGMLVNVSAVSGENNLLGRCEMSLGALYVVTNSGKLDFNYRTTFFHNAGSVALANALAIQTTALADTLWAATDFPSGTTTVVALVLQRVAGGAANIADDTTWSDFTDIRVLGQRMDRYGTLLTGAAGLISPSEVLASQVVEDLLGRLLTFCDPGTAQVDVTTFGIDQLVYADGVKAAGVLSGLELWEPDYLWEILETSANGLHRFNYRAWPTTVRYEVSAKDGWKQTGSDVDLCNRILVSWNDAAGLAHVTPVTASDIGMVGLGLPVDELEEQGRIKDADPISLPDGFGSIANATRIGAAILTDKINPPKAGTVTVRRPIIDLSTGMRVMPWELEPGYLCRVRETGDELRITQVDYDDDSVSSVLTLGTPVLSTDQRIARLSAAAPEVWIN